MAKLMKGAATREKLEGIPRFHSFILVPPLGASLHTYVVPSGMASAFVLIAPAEPHTRERSDQAAA
jgi:hypothetical protein